MDDDIAAIVGKTIEGFEVNEETMAMEIIREVEPMRGTYLNKAHTRTLWKKEYYVPKSADRLTYQEWLKKGRKNSIDYARERMEEVLAAHKPTPITPEQDKEMDRILEEAKKYYWNRGLL